MRVQNCIIENKGNDFNFSKNENHLRNEKMERIINIENSVIKHCEINRALQYNGYPKAIRAKTAEEGLAMIEEAIDKKTPYELHIVDMHFAVNGIDDWKAGEYVISELKRRNIKIPIIVCSSVRYNYSNSFKYPNVIDCVFYNENRDLNWDFKEALKKI